MRREMYYSEAEARKVAEQYARENNGIVDRKQGMVDSRMRFDYQDDDVLSIQCSGESAAIRVRDAESYAEIALFGYWE